VRINQTLEVARPLSANENYREKGSVFHCLEKCSGRRPLVGDFVAVLPSFLGSMISIKARIPALPLGRSKF
jgi:hypothetical protein